MASTATEIFNAQQQSAADEFKNGWDTAPDAGVGQFTGPFANAGQGLSSVPADPASELMQQQPIAPVPTDGSNFDALPTTPTGTTSTDPIAAALATSSNYSSASPYVSGVTEGGDVGRQADRPDRLAIDDTMSAEEQYRRAWQNEANDYYGSDVDKVAVTPEAAPVAESVTAQAAAAPVEYGISYQGPTDSSDGEATVYDKATGRVIKQFPGTSLYQRLSGIGSINSDQLKEYTGWSDDAATPAAQAKPAAINNGEFA